MCLVASMVTSAPAVYGPELPPELELPPSAPPGPAQARPQPPDPAEPAPTPVRVSRYWPSAILQWGEPISAASTAYALDPDLIAAVIMVESGGDAKAHGASGERGLMQIMPFHSCVSWEPALNIDCGAWMLASMIERAGGDRRVGLAAYNAGETSRDRDGNGWGYADKVLALYHDTVVK